MWIILFILLDFLTQRPLKFYSKPSTYSKFIEWSGKLDQRLIDIFDLAITATCYSHWINELEKFNLRLALLKMWVII